MIVLQRSTWPFTVQKSSVDIPLSVGPLCFLYALIGSLLPVVQMQAELMAYANYYKHRHSGHTLDWDHALETVTMKARFGLGPKELSLSLYQAVVLLLFNESPEWRYPDILEWTRMGVSSFFFCSYLFCCRNCLLVLLDDAELRRALQSLGCGKKKVLKKVPPGREVDDGDLFRFNEDPRAKVHINSIQAKVSVRSVLSLFLCTLLTFVTF